MRKKERMWRRAMKEFTDSRNRPDFSPLQDCPGRTPFQLLTRPPSLSFYPRLLLFSSYPLFSGTLDALVSSSLLQNWTIRENLPSPRVSSLVCRSIPRFRSRKRVLGPKKARRPKFWGARTAGDIVSHCATSRSSSRCNLWKASQSSRA